MYQLSNFPVIVGALNRPTVIFTVIQNLHCFQIKVLPVILQCCTVIDVGPRLSFCAFKTVSCCVVLV